MIMNELWDRGMTSTASCNQPYMLEATERTGHSLAEIKVNATLFIHVRLLILLIIPSQG